MPMPPRATFLLLCHGSMEQASTHRPKIVLHYLPDKVMYKSVATPPVIHHELRLAHCLESSADLFRGQRHNIHQEGRGNDSADDSCCCQDYPALVRQYGYALADGV